jgi:hypothetical protein
MEQDCHYNEELAIAVDWRNLVVSRTHPGWHMVAVVARIEASHP